jgi:hypothetical protein
MDWRILVFYPEPEARDKIYLYPPIHVKTRYTSWLPWFLIIMKNTIEHFISISHWLSTFNFRVPVQLWEFGCSVVIINTDSKILKWTRKCGHYEQLSFIYRLKLYALFINGGNETVLYRQWFAMYRCPLRQFLPLPLLYTVFYYTSFE